MPKILSRLKRRKPKLPLDHGQPRDQMHGMLKQQLSLRAPNMDMCAMLIGAMTREAHTKRQMAEWEAGEPQRRQIQAIYDWLTGGWLSLGPNSIFPRPSNIFPYLDPPIKVVTIGGTSHEE